MPGRGSALRRKIGIVGQNARLFAGTIRGNVCLGEPVEEAAIWEALRLAGVDEDVRAMPLGLSTPVSEAVVTLSGGQVQRILFARAILGKPNILILDEATSALEAREQARIVASCQAAGMTVISVAHRLETVLHCNRIYVLSGGRIVEKGAPTELIQAGGLLARMVAAELQPAA